MPPKILILSPCFWASFNITFSLSSISSPPSPFSENPAILRITEISSLRSCFCWAFAFSIIPLKTASNFSALTATITKSINSSASRASLTLSSPKLFLTERLIVLAIPPLPITATFSGFINETRLRSLASTLYLLSCFVSNLSRASTAKTSFCLVTATGFRSISETTMPAFLASSTIEITFCIIFLNSGLNALEIQALFNNKSIWLLFSKGNGQYDTLAFSSTPVPPLPIVINGPNCLSKTNPIIYSLSISTASQIRIPLMSSFAIEALLHTLLIIEVNAFIIAFCVLSIILTPPTFDLCKASGCADTTFITTFSVSNASKSFTFISLISSINLYLGAGIPNNLYTSCSNNTLLFSLIV